MCSAAPPVKITPPTQLLDRYLSKLPLKGFPYEEAVIFCDALRRLVGWEEIRYTLEKYIEKQVQERYFLVGERDDGFTVFPPCTVLPELRAEDMDEGLLRFACYVAICHTVYGQSFESLTTCTGRVLNPSPPNTSSAWFPRFVLTW